MRTRSRGFTLVEMLVALFAMALLAVMSWRALDGMSRARSYTEARADEVLALQVGLAQWTADLDAAIDVSNLAPIEWNGRAFRITRRSTASPTDGVMVVAWARRAGESGGTWLRWQSPQVFTRGELQEAWQRADLWAQNPANEDMAREVAVIPLADWQVFFFRQNAWTNPQSSSAGTSLPPAPGGAPPVNPGSDMPDGVRLVLELPQGRAIAGTLVRDWVRPTLGRPQP